MVCRFILCIRLIRNGNCHSHINTTLHNISRLCILLISLTALNSKCLTFLSLGGQRNAQTGSHFRNHSSQVGFNLSEVYSETAFFFGITRLTEN